MLLALLVLATPLLLSARGADQASTRLADRADGRLALDSAGRHARSVLYATYPSADLDRTPYHDGLDELRVENRFPAGFLDANDPHGAMWDVDARDVAGLVDLDSASPHVLANLMGLAARFVAVVPKNAKELPLSSAAGLEPAGFLWAEGETILYSKLEGATAVQFTRGVLGPGEGTEWRGGPRPASDHGIGTPVLDQRALAPALWRTQSADGELRTYGALEELPACAGFALAAATDPLGPGVMRAELMRPLRTSGSVHAGVRSGPRWQRAARLAQDVKGQQDGRIRVDDPRWLNAGATVRIRDGGTSQIALVQNVLGNGEVALDRILKDDYAAYEAVVEVLARRPVNLNSAPRAVLVALFENLQIGGQNSRVTNDEATALADVVIASRPLTGFEDFLRRVVLPAAGLEKLPSDAPVVPEALRSGEAFLDPMDALAVYANGLNANDFQLAWSTMPYAFTSRDVYALELRSAINAPSGVLRCAYVREDVACIAPQTPLIRLWARQEDLDEELRLSCDAPWWATGPNATTRWDVGSVPPSRLWAQMGTFEGQTYLPGVTDTSGLADGETAPAAEHVFPSREDRGFAQLMPTRLHETQRLQERVIHFDHESRDHEGRWLPDETVARSTDDEQVGWTAATAPLLRPMALSMWVKPRTVGDARWLDVAGTSATVDRVMLLVEGPDLVLRVLDGMGDHRDTTPVEAGEMRYAIGESPGLPPEVWHHVEIDVRGNRPSQMHMLVNGLAHGVRTPGLTRLTGAVSQNMDALPVESVEGFPPYCVVRVGNEVIEATVQGTSLSTLRVQSGAYAGFGGRMARQRAAQLTEDVTSPPAGLDGLSVDHAAGAPVELYGYSLPLLSDAPSGGAELAQGLGKFRVAMLAGVVGGVTPQGDPITVGLGWNVGDGIKGRSSTVNGLVLRCADDGDATEDLTPPEEYMTAFHPDGGYAALVQTQWNWGDGEEVTDTDGAILGGVEIFRYGGWSGTTLQIVQRGVSSSELPNLGELAQGQADFIGGQRSFVWKWSPSILVGGENGGDLVQNRLYHRTFVVPISLRVPSASDVRGYLAAQKGNSQFAQLTHVSDAENTEWVRYDWFDTARGQLVRDDPDALTVLYNVLTRGVRLETDPEPPDDPPPGGGEAPAGSAKALPDPVPAEPPPPAAQTYSTSAWDARVGQNENPAADWPISRAVETWFQFRAVGGTFSHVHAAGTPILPVFYCSPKGTDGGRPGAMDAVFLVGSDPTHPGWPLRLARSHLFAPEHEIRDWDQRSGASVPTPRSVTPREPFADTEAYLQERLYVALQTRSPENVVAGTAVANPGAPIVDTRLIARLVCFPSGERPRAVSKVQIGGDADQPGSAVPSALVDEIAFGDAQFGRETPVIEPESMAGASLILAADVDEGATQLLVQPKAVRVAGGDVGADHEYLADLPPNGGLLRLGDEIVAWRSWDAQAGTIELAQDGRGKLGTRPQAHEITDPVTFLEHRVAGVLTAPVGASDGALTLANVEGFAPEGLVIAGTELIHYARIRGTALEMPRASTVAGAMDGRGAGLFRGRFGTQPAGHAGADCVIQFPLRYPDRWARGADAPELAYFGFEVDQPAAFFTGVFFAKVDTPSARVGVLERSDPTLPWDQDPELDPRLRILWDGQREGKEIPIGRQADRCSWRVFVEYQAGAFDALGGAAHGWRQTPRLTMLSAFYLAPNVTLRSVER